MKLKPLSLKLSKESRMLKPLELQLRRINLRKQLLWRNKREKKRKRLTTTPNRFNWNMKPPSQKQKR